MITNWQLLYSTTYYTQAAIIKGKLENNEIPVQLLNKQDSMYGITIAGNYELYVPAYFKELANSLLNESLNN